MKTLIQIVMVSLVVGGISAGGSFYWHQKQAQLAAKTAELKHTEDESSEKDDDSESDDEMDVAESTDAAEDHSDDQRPANIQVDQPESKPDAKLAELRPITPEVFGPPAGVRPPYDPNGDEAALLINRLRERAANGARQERRLVEREEAMSLITEDLRIEQAKALKLRRRYNEEFTLAIRDSIEERRAMNTERTAIYRAAKNEINQLQQDEAEKQREAEEKIANLQREKDEAVAAAEEARNAARQEQESIKRQQEELSKPAVEEDRSALPEESPNLPNLTGVMESMPVESAASALQAFVEKGKTELAIAVLGGMKPKKAANLLAVIQETQPELVADLLEKLKRYQKNKAAAGAAKK